MKTYPPSEDTFLLLDNLRCGKEVLEIGTGSGIIAMECAKRGSEVTAVDIDENAIAELKKRAEEEGIKIHAFLSDLFENVTGKFDTIIFNPPYLPGDAKEIEDLQWAGGGEHGDEIIMRFLSDAWRYLKDGGEIYIILSSFNRIEKMKKFPYRFELLAELKLSFHKIFLYRLRRA